MKMVYYNSLQHKIKSKYRTIKFNIRKYYYKIMHGFNMGGMSGTIFPITGKGKYISVYSKGKIIQIKHESGYSHMRFDEIRIIPYQSNHGVMVERFRNGQLKDRQVLDFNALNSDFLFLSNKVK